MRKLLFIPVLILFSCTQTKQQKAEKVVKLYLDSTLNDPHSYESVEFGKLDSTFTRFEDDARYISAKAKQDSIKAEYDMWKAKNPDFDGVGDLSHSRVLYFSKMINYYTNGMLAQGKIAIGITNSFKPTFKGYRLIHRYRAKNVFGALNLSQTPFYLDSALTRVTDVDKSE